MADTQQLKPSRTARQELAQQDLETAPLTLDDFNIERVMSDFAGITSSKAVRCGASGFRKRVLLKVAREAMAQAPDANQRIIDEARIGMRVAHPNLLQVLDLGRDQDRLFLVREWVVGVGARSLMARTWSARRSLPTAASLRIGICLARALAYLHGLRSVRWAPAGISHRLVTPGNVIISARGEVRLTNLSRAEVDARFDSEWRQVDDGFPAFAAPEVLAGESPTHSSDIYGLGALLYEALTGPDAMVGSPDSDWTRTRRTLDLQSEIAASGLPRTLRQLLIDATSREPSERPAATEINSGLRRWLYDALDSDGEDELRQAVANAGAI